MEDMMESARTAVEQCLAVEAGETVLVVTDSERREIGRAVEAAATEVTEAVYMEIPADERHGTEPPRPVAAAMRACDVVFAPTTRSLTHTQARMRACDAAARVATMPGITREIMLGAMRADYTEVERRAMALLEEVQGSREVHITSPQGTDLTLQIGSREWHPDTGICHDAGCVTNLPAGEVYVAPEGGDGTLVVDGSMAGLGRLDSPLEIEFRDGRATSISDNRLEGMVEEAGECGRNLAELGVGVNRAATLIGNVLQDEKVMGTVHVALGDSSGFGGDVECDLHVDGVLTEPVVEVDGEEIDLS